MGVDGAQGRRGAAPDRLLEQRPARSCSGLPGAEQLVKEVRAYTVKQSARTGNVSTEAEREADHDDLVIALALAVWYSHVYGTAPLHRPHDRRAARSARRRPMPQKGQAPWHAPIRTA